MTQDIHTAQGVELDHIGDQYGFYRLANESYRAFRARVLAHILASHHRTLVRKALIECSMLKHCRDSEFQLTRVLQAVV